MSVSRVIQLVKALGVASSTYVSGHWDTGLDGKPHQNAGEWAYILHPLSASPGDHPPEDGNLVFATFGLTISRRLGKYPPDQMYSAIYDGTDGLERRAFELIDLIQSNKYTLRNSYTTDKPSWCYDLLDGPDWDNSLQYTTANTLWYNPSPKEVVTAGCYVPIIFKLHFGKVYQ